MRTIELSMGLIRNLIIEKAVIMGQISYFWSQLCNYLIQSNQKRKAKSYKIDAVKSNCNITIRIY